MESEAIDWEVIVVDDGSEDATVSIVDALVCRDPRIRLVRGGPHGKGAAVRRGMLAARGRWRFMADADLSMPPDNLRRFLRATETVPGPPDVLIGSREAEGAERIGEPWLRHAAGRVFNALVRASALPGIQDTQCGFKMFSAEAAVVLFSRSRLDGFAFDAEILWLARRAGFTIHEVGIEWHSRPDSRVGLLTGAAAFWDILRLRAYARQGRYSNLRRPTKPAEPGSPQEQEGTAASRRSPSSHGASPASERRDDGRGIGVPGEASERPMLLREHAGALDGSVEDDDA
jgi:dolichyl-phosphate beta-glucosyltransferase